jgi:AcrR family transcriptional regulator
MVKTRVQHAGASDVKTSRRLGRPDQQASEALVQHILDVATSHFIEHGFTATSLERIARAAGAGKQTLYRRFESKQALFIAVIDRESSRLLSGAYAAAEEETPPFEALRHTCRELLDFVLRPELIALHRILVAESIRFPELGRHVLDTCLAPYTAALGDLIEAAAQAGQFAPEPHKDARDLLLGLIIGWPSQKALLDPGILPTHDQRDAYFASAWTLFSRAVQTG